MYVNLDNNNLPEITIELSGLIESVKTAINVIDVKTALEVLKQLHRKEFHKRYAVDGDNDQENEDLWFFWNGKEYLVDVTFLLNQAPEFYGIQQKIMNRLRSEIRNEYEFFTIFSYAKILNIYPYYVATSGKDCDGFSRSRLYGFYGIESATNFANSCMQASDGIYYTVLTDPIHLMDYISKNEITDTAYRLVTPMPR